MNKTNNFMELAAQEALNGMRQGHGGPFGAVIVRKNDIIACEHNRVIETNDPTMHAEIAAIRAACGKLGNFSLHDCEIYSSCMPCPMCLSAIIWAKIPKLYYGADASDAANAGFDDDYIYKFIKKDGVLKGDDKLSVERVCNGNFRNAFDEWNNLENKNMY